MCGHGRLVSIRQHTSSSRWQFLDSKLTSRGGTHIYVTICRDDTNCTQLCIQRVIRPEPASHRRDSSIAGFQGPSSLTKGSPHIWVANPPHPSGHSNSFEVVDTASNDANKYRTDPPPLHPFVRVAATLQTDRIACPPVLTKFNIDAHIKSKRVTSSHGLEFV